MSKRETNEKKLREKFRKKSLEDQQKIDSLFKEIDHHQKEEERKQQQQNIEGIKTYKDLILNKYEEKVISGVKFKFRLNATAIEFEEKDLITNPEEKLQYIHKFLVEPDIPFDDFKQLPPEIYKYIEQKIMENFLRGLVEMALS